MSFDSSTGAPPPQNPWAVDVLGGRFERNTYFINRKLLSLGNKYYVYDELNQPLFFIDRPVLALKAEFTVYADDTKEQRLLTVTQESALTIINFTFVVKDPHGTIIGYLRRQGLQSIFRRVWHIEDGTERTIALAMEDSWPKAILRRLIGEQSLVGMLVRTNFIIVRAEKEPPIGEFNRRMTLTDKHILDMSNDPTRTMDRRLALALGLVLDNTEHQR